MLPGLDAGGFENGFEWVRSRGDLLMGKALMGSFRKFVGSGQRRRAWGMTHLGKWSWTDSALA
jgi:hypothetical protein